MYGNYKNFLEKELKSIRESGLFKKERIIDVKGAATEFWVSEKENQKQ